MGQLDGQVAFITGVARGQGRSHALTLAREGADIIGLDLCAKPSTTAYDGATYEDLQETIRLVKETGRQIVAEVADTRDYEQVESVFTRGIEQFGRVDIVLPNAGICSGAKTWEITPDAWREMVEINLNGVFHTVKAAIPTMIAAGRGGSIVFTGSTEAIKGAENISSYAASKHGVTGLMTSLARELGQYNIRVNSVNPTCVDTHMINNDFVYGLFRPDLDKPTREDVIDTFAGTHILPVPWIQPQDVSNAILYLVTEPGRYITATPLVIDAGFIVKS
ncbi:mycofactocin-coupled SDR family oxidoreductase [Mycolicibacterium brisbanense]|uniref:3-ketoacyl-ACP reductase n=1 Tax=Mycolicibacterium brisbanense TaxID=146020 RepID=A0A100W149_9MYCO|nr:mycofactocin-coupled SDR family oxidoreductase [Mycolicibacterium brisbanense]MCV7160096.1 mycofactocin-coupled SDR family oxidoreductase [Mycolicibacterium brisbanense]GAS89724.1 3-ketoacyl-ACP reductase [Mycolicibacterium brisbanense]